MAQWPGYRVWTPQALLEPKPFYFIGDITIDDVETDLITPITGIIYFESLSTTFYDSGNVENPAAILKVYMDVVNPTVPTITLLPSDLTGKFKIATLEDFVFKSQSPGSIAIEPKNPDPINWLRITGQGTAVGDYVSRIIKYRR